MLVRAIARVDDGRIADAAARKCGAPDAAWRITMASGRIAASVFSVSTSDSPFDTLDACAVMETASAPSLFAAISKLVRVRVEASKNRLTIISSAQRIQLLEATASGAAENRERGRESLAILARSRSSIPSRPLSWQFASCRRVLHQQHFLHAVDFLELHFDDFVRRVVCTMRPI